VTNDLGKRPHIALWVYRRVAAITIKLVLRLAHDDGSCGASAFAQACAALLLKGDVEDPMTEIMVDKIVALEKAGEYDASRLAELILNDLVDDGLDAAS
jgi:hypothetical protein